MPTIRALTRTPNWSRLVRPYLTDQLVALCDACEDANAQGDVEAMNAAEDALIDAIFETYGQYCYARDEEPNKYAIEPDFGREW